MPRQFTLPDLGEGVTEAEIVAVLVREGDVIREDAPREGDRIRDARDGRDGSALKPVALHDRGVDLDDAVAVEN